MGFIMKSPHCLKGWAVLGAVVFMPLVTQAQNSRPFIYTDAEHAARAQQEARARMAAQQQEQIRQQRIMHHLQCLKNTTLVLQQSFSDHCSRRKFASTSPEIELSRALTELLGDVNHLSDDILGRCGKIRQVDLAHMYRTFHMMEYSTEDAQTVASQAGYSRSLAGHFQDIREHINELGEAGFRNPRLNQIQMKSHFHGGRVASAQERQFSLPPVPASPPPAAIPTVEPGSPRRPGTHIDLGDMLGRLFGKKPR